MVNLSLRCLPTVGFPRSEIAFNWLPPISPFICINHLYHVNSPEKGQKNSIFNHVFLNVKNNHLMLKRADDKRKREKHQWKLITWLSLQVLSSVLAADRKCHFPITIPPNKQIKHKTFAVKQFYLRNCTFAFSIKGGKPAGISNAVFKSCSSRGSLVAGLHVIRVWNGPTCSFSK